MKTTLIAFLLFASYISINAQTLGIVESKNHYDIHDLFKQESVTVHFYKDDFAIISGEYDNTHQYSILEENGFEDGFKYFIHYTNDKELLELKESISEIGEIIFNNQTISILKIKESLVSKFSPVKNDALIYFDKEKAFISNNDQSKYISEISFNQDIATMLAEVNADSIEATISYLSSYTTRDCYSTDVVNALNWINAKFESYGLTVMTQALSGYGIPSFNVIATQEGEINSTEYVIVGGHADSRSSDATAPGADDNASGVAGVLEIARILRQETFDRTIIYCAFSGEEYGLYGSKYFANDFRNNNKNVIGYVNLDMIGYTATQSLQTSLIYPSTAKYLADYYKTICSTYLPNLIITDGVLTGGSSDHASFNNYGYMGIFPFENVNSYSPYIHTSNDILGLSVNNMEFAETLTKAALATITSLANSNINLSDKNNIIDSNYFTIYPNPATTSININFEGQHPVDIKLYNVLGKLIIKKTIQSSENIDVSNLTRGAYFIKLNSKDYTTVKKCIIN